MLVLYIHMKDKLKVLCFVMLTEEKPAVGLLWTYDNLIHQICQDNGKLGHIAGPRGCIVHTRNGTPQMYMVLKLVMVSIIMHKFFLSIKKVNLKLKKTKN